ncbi:MAG: hypothetical protein EP343_06430 [Deltaproteobacteria bacterium]|nr:MAG: hypothetical protein EP343_06430 [Deltaproteobacteria bacterium]
MHKALTYLLLFCSGCLALGLSYGCAGPTPARQEVVRSLRILGVRSEPPAARPGETIQLTALIANPFGRKVRYRWLACKSRNQANSGCANRDDAISLGTSAKASYKVPEDFVPENASLVDQFRGVYLPITLVVETDVDQEEAIKRVVVSKLPTNKNPNFSNLEMFAGDSDKPEAEPWTYQPGQTYKFVPTINKDSFESSLTLSPDGTITVTTENMVLAWYITIGQIRGGRQSLGKSPARTWVAPGPDAVVSQATIYILMRDGRGGIQWLERTLRKREP